MNPLITGATNIIAIDNQKKASFIKIYNDAISNQKKENIIHEQPMLPEEPLNFEINSTATKETLTNADVLSQSLEPISPAVTDSKPIDEFKAPGSANSDLTEIVYDIAKIQDSLDKVVAKILANAPDKKVVENINQEIQSDIIKSEEPITKVEQTPLFEEATQQEISPFVPSSGNIFDVPQGPNMAA